MLVVNLSRTWNLCLGLRNKKDYVSKIITKHQIDITCLQETDIEPDYPQNILAFKGYDYLSENNSVKARVGMYVNTEIPYQITTVRSTYLTVTLLLMHFKLIPMSIW